MRQILMAIELIRDVVTKLKSKDKNRARWFFNHLNTLYPQQPNRHVKLENSPRNLVYKGLHNAEWCSDVIEIDSQLLEALQDLEVDGHLSAEQSQTIIKNLLNTSPLNDLVKDTKDQKGIASVFANHIAQQDLITQKAFFKSVLNEIQQSSNNVVSDCTKAQKMALAYATKQQVAAIQQKPQYQALSTDQADQLTQQLKRYNPKTVKIWRYMLDQIAKQGFSTQAFWDDSVNQADKLASVIQLYHRLNSDKNANREALLKLNEQLHQQNVSWLERVHLFSRQDNTKQWQYDEILTQYQQAYASDNDHQAEESVDPEINNKLHELEQQLDEQDSNWHEQSQNQQEDDKAFAELEAEINQLAHQKLTTMLVDIFNSESSLAHQQDHAASGNAQDKVAVSSRINQNLNILNHELWDKSQSNQNKEIPPSQAIDAVYTDKDELLNVVNTAVSHDEQPANSGHQATEDPRSRASSTPGQSVSGSSAQQRHSPSTNAASQETVRGEVSRAKSAAYQALSDMSGVQLTQDILSPFNREQLQTINQNLNQVRQNAPTGMLGLLRAFFTGDTVSQFKKAFPSGNMEQNAFLTAMANNPANRDTITTSIDSWKAGSQSLTNMPQADHFVQQFLHDKLNLDLSNDWLNSHFNHRDLTAIQKQLHKVNEAHNQTGLIARVKRLFTNSPLQDLASYFPKHNSDHQRAFLTQMAQNSGSNGQSLRNLVKSWSSASNASVTAANQPYLSQTETADATQVEIEEVEEELDVELGQQNQSANAYVSAQQTSRSDLDKEDARPEPEEGQRKSMRM